MLRRIVIVLAVMILTGVMIGCEKSEPSHGAQVVGTDMRLMGRDIGTVLGLNRSGAYNPYETPCYIDGH